MELGGFSDVPAGLPFGGSARDVASFEVIKKSRAVDAQGLGELSDRAAVEVLRDELENLVGECEAAVRPVLQAWQPLHSAPRVISVWS